MDDQTTDGNRISRRSTLKGIGVAGGAAVAWSAPQIVSTTAASAATAPHNCTGPCGPDPCLDQTPCGTDSVTGNNCFCTQEEGTGNCICTQDVPCAGLTPCSGTCPPGFICQTGCCGSPHCFPLCA